MIDSPEKIAAIVIFSSAATSLIFAFVGALWRAFSRKDNQMNEYSAAQNDQPRRAPIQGQGQAQGYVHINTGYKDGAPMPNAPKAAEELGMLVERLHHLSELTDSLHKDLTPVLLPDMPLVGVGNNLKEIHDGSALAERIRGASALVDTVAERLRSIRARLDVEGLG